MTSDFDPVFLSVVGFVLLIGGALLLAIFMRSGKSQLDKEKYQSKWLSIESSLHRDSAASFAMAVINADKLLDLALRERGFSGKTMGERLKSAKNNFSNINAIWSAHKMRNKIAHETEVKLNYDASRRALASFKQGLKDLGAI